MKRVMKYKYSSKYRKAAKKTAVSIKKYQVTKNSIKNPIKMAINRLIERASKLDTNRKSRGAIKNRVQRYNPKTKRFTVFNTTTGKILRTRKKKGTRYKNIRIV